jgi:4-amino-4-deoxy-L-arabinose transferase-like glycosyltransferase
VTDRDATNRSPDRRWRIAILVVTLAALVRVAVAAAVPVLPDEAYYWEWSRRLAPGYFDHPPGIALVVRAGTALLAPIGASASGLAVRLGAVICGWIAALATIGIAGRLAGDGAALRAAIVIVCIPLAAAGLVLATPDAPLLAATAATLYCVVRALRHAPGSPPTFRWWVAAGLALGVAFASKYTSVFVPIGVVVAMLTRRELRARFREPGPYVAVLLAVLVFLPVVVWNAHHGWISVVHQVRHGLSAPRGSALAVAWRHEGDFLGGQAGLASPILFVLLAIATARSLGPRASSAAFTLGVVTVVTFGFFLYSATRQRVEPNWPSPAYIPAIALLATTRWGPRGERWLQGGVLLAGLMSAIIYVHALVPVLPLAPARDPIARAFGWKGLARAADSSARAATTASKTTTWLGGDRYQEAAELAFHVESHPTTFAVNLAGRDNQYDLWPRFPDRAHGGDNLLLVLDDSDQPPGPIEQLAPFFASVQRGDRVMLRRGNRDIAARRVWLLLGWNGRWPVTR